MRSILFTVFIILMSGCGMGSSPKVQEKWSVRMANTVIASSDSLIHYVAGRPKWAYDVAFLGMAMDKLG
jgi:unsaturated rhamnogalacturonyl hydrolase